MSELSTVAKRFFNFIEAYASVKNKMQTDYQQAGETQELEELRKEHLPGVSIGDAGSEVVLRVERPILYKCPPPPSEISDWIGLDWTNYKVINPQRIDKKPIIDNTEENYIGNNKNNHHKNEINFNDDPARIKAWEQWIYKRNKWLNNYGPLKEAFQLYSTLFSWRSTIKKEGYSKGCFLCNGFVRSEDGKINYPLLLQHVHIELDSSNEQAILSVKIVNDSPIRIASDVLHQTEDEFNLQALNDLANINDKFSFDLMDPDSFGPQGKRI